MINGYVLVHTRLRLKALFKNRFQLLRRDSGIDKNVSNTESKVDLR